MPAISSRGGACRTVRCDGCLPPWRGNWSRSGIMQLSVFGLDYLGSVAAGCLASQGHQVIAVDPDADKVATIRRAVAPVNEPGVSRLIKEAVAMRPAARHHRSRRGDRGQRAHQHLRRNHRPARPRGSLAHPRAVRGDRQRPARQAEIPRRRAAQRGAARHRARLHPAGAGARLGQAGGAAISASPSIPSSCGAAARSRTISIRRP